MTCTEAEALFDDLSIPEGDHRLDEALAHIDTCAECRRKSEADEALVNHFFTRIKRLFPTDRWPVRRGRE